MQFPTSSAGQGAIAGIGAVGSLLSGLGQRKEGQQEQAAYDYNTDITMENTRGEMVASEQQYAQLVGRQAVAYASAGVDITRGSPLLMMAATAGRGGRKQAELYQAGTEQANLQRYYGKLAAFRGTMAGVGTFLKGITSAATGYLQGTGYVPGGKGNIPTIGTDYTGIG